MKKQLSHFAIALAMILLALSLCPLQLAGLSTQGLASAPVNAEEAADAQAAKTGGEAAATAEDALRQTKAWSAGVTLALVGLAGAIAMGWVISKSVESIAKQPEAESGIRGSLMIGLVFIETLVIYALVVAILIVFVL